MSVRRMQKSEMRISYSSILHGFRYDEHEAYTRSLAI